MESASHDPASEQILEHLNKLESRIARIEIYLGISPTEKKEESSVDTDLSSRGQAAEDELELQIGQNWFARVGIVVLALGVVFLLTFPYQNLAPVLPSMLGYILVGAIFGLSRFWRSSFEQTSRYLLGAGLLLLYFSTLRLSHFSPEPALANATLKLVLLLTVVAFDLVVAARKESIYLTGLSIAMGYLTALVGGQAYFVFAVVVAISAVTSYLTVRYGWTPLLLLGTLFAYFTHFFWSINNPLLGNQVEQLTSPYLNLLFILLYCSVLAAGTLLQGRDLSEKPAIIAAAFLNGGASYGLFVFLTLTAFRADMAFWHFLASAVYLILSILFWLRQKSKYATFVYAMLGYMALSVALVASFSVPDSFVWLCWQSILVLSTAVWFRSRFIVVANFGIYLVILLAYLFTAGKASVVSVSFGVVALLSARILNWQKDRLELKTEMMRNAYLAGALFVIPYALYHSLPPGYVSLSWLVVALFYYIMSRLLKNSKYRWMALLTTALTIVYVFLVDLVGLDPVFRIISFLVLGSVLLSISMIYTRRRMRTRSGGAG